MYKNYVLKYNENIIYEDKAIEKALNYFKGSTLEDRQTALNYKSMNYDALLSTGEKIEIKTDHKSSIYHNFFIEFEQLGQRSNISITDATHYILNDTINYYMIKTILLKEIIFNKHLKRELTIKKCFVGGVLSSRGFVIPCDEIIKHSILLN